MGNDKFVFKIYFKCKDNESYEEEIIAEDAELAINYLYELVHDVKIINRVRNLRRYEYDD